MGFGALMAFSRATMSARCTSMRAEKKDLAVVDKFDLSKTYLNNLPRSILDETTLHKLLSTVPKSEWDNPPEDSYLFMLKMYAETYGEGKATKMGWWDYWYMRINAVEADEFPSGPELDQRREWEIEKMRDGVQPMWLPGPSQLFPTGTTFKWRGAEPFAADLIQTPVNAGLFAKQFVKSWAFYRDGLKPWQRGLEIGLAHGYFLIGPFTSLGQLRDTPEAATVGLLSGVVVVGMATVGGLIFGKTQKPTFFDKDGDEPASGFNEMMQAHGAGGIGGAAFAHSLISVFGS